MRIDRFAGREFEDTDDGLTMRLGPEDRTPIGALRLLLNGVEMLREVGCIDHVDCADPVDGAAWETALINARAVVKASADTRNS